MIIDFVEKPLKREAATIKRAVLYALQFQGRIIKRSILSF
jgi:hypothetical protein